MKHIDSIKAFLKVMQESDNFNALILKSPPGWAKSTTIHQALETLNLNYVAIGSYSTSLAFYRALAMHPKKILVLDDCAGLFDDPLAMAVLKAATWPSVGSEKRRVAWNSLTTRIEEEQKDIIFEGKLILLTNSLPGSHDIEAFKSRCIFYSIDFNREEIMVMLKKAALNKHYFPNTRLAGQVVNFIIDNIMHRDYNRFNLRTLAQGYEIAQIQPRNWKKLFEEVMPSANSAQIVTDLHATGMDVEEQARVFMARTGMTRRNFFHYRKKLTLSNPENSKAGIRMSKRATSGPSAATKTVRRTPRRAKR